MNAELFDWDDANLLHVAEHDVSPEEAEAILLGDSLEAAFDSTSGEERWAYIGETLEGRILRVVLTLRERRMRVVTAFDASARAKQIYLKWKAGNQ